VPRETPRRKALFFRSGREFGPGLSCAPSRACIPVKSSVVPTFFAYLVDIPLQRSLFAIRSETPPRRIMVDRNALGLLLANDWIADEIYPYTR